MPMPSVTSVGRLHYRGRELFTEHIFGRRAADAQVRQTGARRFSLDSFKEARNVAAALLCSNTNARRISERGVHELAALSSSFPMLVIFSRCPESVCAQEAAP